MPAKPEPPGTQPAAAQAGAGAAQPAQGSGGAQQDKAPATPKK